MKEKQIVFLRLPVNLSGDVKNIIGTIVLSEITHAAFERDKVSEAERAYCGIYCDEFQEFATPDCARRFTQTGKYKVMPTVVHQTRRGQFKPGDPNAGATLASPNEVLFTLSSYDARELALECAKDPQKERYVISQQPVRDLLDGHHSPQIAEFNKYLRYLVDKRDDIRADMEGARMARLNVIRPLFTERRRRKRVLQGPPTMPARPLPLRQNKPRS